MMLDQREDAQQLQNIRAKYAFDKSYSEQYLLYLNDLSPLSIHSQNPSSYTNLESKEYHFYPLFSLENYDVVLKYPYLRTSFKKSGKSVSSIIADTLPNTIVLAFSSIAIAIVLGLLVGIVAAIFKDSWIDKLALLFGVFGMSIPSFFSAILIAWIFGFVLHDDTGD
jgi:peptide/nickel transport system permease protein